MVDHELIELKREFLHEAREKVGEMQSALENASSESLDRISYLAHQLKGAGGSYGYQRISSDAAALEHALEKRNGGTTVDPQIQQHVVNLRSEIDRCARDLQAALTH